MAAGARAAVEPRSSPQIARMCCSNCEVAAPSIVQWPLLWTRGASSLTTSRPSRIRNSSAVSVPTMPIATASRSPRSAARAATSAGIGAGATDSARIPASWCCAPTGKALDRPSRPRATMIDTSMSKGISASARSTSPAGRPSRSSAPSRSPTVSTRTWPRPSYPPVATLIRSGKPERGGGGPELVEGPDLAPGRHLGARLLGEAPLHDPVLGHAQWHAPGPNRHDARRSHRRRRHRHARARRSRRR